MCRYLAAICSTRSLNGTRIAQIFGAALTSKAPKWYVAYEGPGALVLHMAHRGDPPDVRTLSGNAGVVLGRLFTNQRGGRRRNRQIAFTDDETGRIVDSGGKYLVEQYWGSYAAFLYDRSTQQHHIFREPIGTVPCYHTSHEGVDIFFSHIEDCVRYLPLSFSVNRNFLTRWLIFSGLTTRDSGIENVENVPAEERVTVSQAGVSRTLLWDPTELARVPRYQDESEAATELRLTVQDTINAWASCYDNVALKLSGGLDSSIVAGCLAHVPSKVEIAYLHLSIDVGFDQGHIILPNIDRRSAERIRALVGSGDERYFAQLVAERWKVPLLESSRLISMDLRRLWEAPLMTSPAMYFTMMEMDDAEQELVRTRGTQAFFSGQAGDSVLLATSHPLPALDYAYLHGAGASLWRHILETSRLSRESFWAVLCKAVKYGFLHYPYSSTTDLLRRPNLVRKDLVEALTTDDFASHLTKLASRTSLPPGKQYQVSALAGSAYYDFVFHSGGVADHVDPLNSQPVWELMLQIPTYTILTGGTSRGLARRAFADLLPSEIRRRQVKGTGMPFYQQLVKRNKGFLRDHLLDGLLVRNGYLDRAKLDGCLAAEEPSLMVPASSMLSYLAAEVWLQTWADVSKGMRREQQSATFQTCVPKSACPSLVPRD